MPTNIICMGCKNKISLIDIRIAHDGEKGYSCSNCPRTWTVEQLGELLDSVDIQRFKRALRYKLDEGTSCPCCGQYAKRYRRKFNSIMACWLIAFYRAHLEHQDEEFIHVGYVSKYLHSNVSVRSGDYAKARFWSLLEASDEQEPGKRDVGKWKLTEAGRNFVKGVSSISQQVIVYNNMFQGFEGEQIFIKDALGEVFNYDDLMLIPPPAKKSSS